MSAPRVLVAGIGNIFLGDDAFGVEVVQRLLRQPWPEGVRVFDFGIRGLDLAYALADGYDAAILIDALPRGGAPGTLYVLEPDLSTLDGAAPAAIDPHGMDPLKVLRLVPTLGEQRPRRILVLGCEPEPLAADEEFMGLSPPVAAALDGAVEMAAALVQQVRAEAGVDVHA
jgi:hydrogenase maturation protease